MTKSEVIAEFEKYAAFLASVSVYGGNPKLPRQTSIREIRDQIRKVTGETLTVISLEKGLLDPDGFEVAKRLSGRGADTTISFVPDELEYYFDSYSRVDESLIARMKSYGSSELRKDLSEARRKAVEHFDQYKGIGQHIDVPAPVSKWASLSLHAVKGHVMYLADRTPGRARSSLLKKSLRSQPIDWQKWGAIAGIAALPLAVLIWWFTK